MLKQYHFNKVTNNDKLSLLKKEWLDNLPSPQDGMWAYFRDNAIHWSIEYFNEVIGYAVVNEDNELLQFYISSKFLINEEIIFKAFINKMKIKSGIVGTNNPNYLSSALVFAKDIKINTYLFRDNNEVTVVAKEGKLKNCENNDREKIVNFYNYSIGAPKEWLNEYIGGLIDKDEIYVLENESDIIGTCEVRISASASKFADIGMVVSPKYRKKGHGTHLLYQAKNIAIALGKTPICSCEKDNAGSIKSIYNCGFFSEYQLLTISFK